MPVKALDVLKTSDSTLTMVGAETITSLCTTCKDINCYIQLLQKKTLCIFDSLQVALADRPNQMRSPFLEDDC